MTDEDRIDDLGELFESITGETSVVEPQRMEPDSRDVDADPDARTVDTIEYHGLADAIDGSGGSEVADTPV